MATTKSESIRISEQTKQDLVDLRARYDLGMNAIVDKVISWFSDQPEETQSAILMALPKSMQPEFAAFALQRLTRRMQMDDTDRPKTMAINTDSRLIRGAAKSGPTSSPGKPKP